MNRSRYYEDLKALARAQRSKHHLSSSRVLLNDLRRIYRAEGILRIDLWAQRLQQLRGAYFNDELGATVMIDRSLPLEPRVFTMAHELKHHLVDSAAGHSFCATTNVAEAIEIGAEVFAAELIFPEADFHAAMASMGVVAGACSPETLVRLKHQSRTTLSYTGLAKRAMFLGYAPNDSLHRFSGWRRLEERLYGVPVYKRFRRHR